MWPALDEGAGATWLEAGIAIVLTWITVALGVVRLEVSKWVPNVGAVVKVAIFLGLGVLGLQFILSGRTPANDFSWSAFVPRWTDSLAFLPILLYNTLGFELMSSAGEEMKDPQSDVPRVVLLSGLIIGVAYTLGALGILLVVPLEELSLTTGTWDALAALGPQWGAMGEALTLLLGIGFLYACIANVVTWSLGVNRVAAIAPAEDHMLPAVLGRLHPRFKTPYVAFVIMGVVATALLLGNALLSSNPQNVFWMIFKLSSLCLLLCYLAMFPAFLVLRYKRPDEPRPYRLPGGPAGAWAATVVCWLFVFLTSLLFFKPAPRRHDPTREALLLGGETLLTLVVGLLLVPRAGADPRPCPARPARPHLDEIPPSTTRRSDEPRLGEGRIRVAVEALAARDPKVALLDEVLVEVAGVLERLGVRGGFADQLRDVVHDAEAHAIHHAAGAHAALQGDHPGSIDALEVAHAAHQQVQRGGAPGHDQAVDDVAVLLLANGDGHQADLLGERQHAARTRPGRCRDGP